MKSTKPLHQYIFGAWSRPALQAGEKVIGKDLPAEKLRQGLKEAYRHD